MPRRRRHMRTHYASHVISDWEVFKILLWKNWCVTTSSPWKCILSLFSPLLFSLLLVILRFQTSASLEKVPAREYKPIDLLEEWRDLIDELTRRHDKLKNLEGFSHNVYVPRLIVAYSPDYNVAYNNIIEMAISYLSGIEFKAYPNCRMLRDAMNLNHYLAGVCFGQSVPTLVTESTHPAGIYQNRLAYTLIFPTELRIYNDTYISAYWHTNQLYHPIDPTGNRLGSENDGGFPGYAREGFLTLQNALSRSYIRLVSNLTDDEQVPKTTLCRFPYREHVLDELLLKLDLFLGPMILAGYIFPLTQLVKHIVTEREDNIYNALNTIGVRRWLHYTAWFAYAVLTLTFSISLVLIVLTLHFRKGIAVLGQSSYAALWIYFVFYNMATMGFCLLVSSFASRTTTAIMSTCVFWFITYTPFITSIYDEHTKLSLLLKFVFSNTVLRQSLSLIIKWETHSKGFQLSDFFTPRTVDEQETVGHHVLILIVLTIFYTGIGMLAVQSDNYLSTVLFGEIPIQRGRSIMVHRPRGRRRTEVVEIERSNRVCTVNVDNVSKMYDGAAVIRDVSLKLYENTITVLMGHNGAGKTVLLSIIADLIEHSEGVVSFDDSVADKEKGISVGMYITHRMLFRHLTVEQQLKFFGRIKGTAPGNVNSEVERYINQMDLLDKMDVLTGDLPVGITQQLGVCCALLGNTRIVILDEPTTHMDVLEKKRFWKMIESEKLYRTVLMSTHLPEDAKILADRVIIMSEGTIKYSGSSSLLRTFYDKDCHLICTKGTRCKSAQVTELLRRYMPHVEPMSDICNELSYTIAEEYFSDISEMVDELEEHSRELDIISFEINENSLADIFFMLGAEHASDGDHERQSEIMNGKTVYFKEFEFNHYLDQVDRITGLSLLYNQLLALLLKRFYYIRRYKFAQFMQLFVPVFVTMFSMVFVRLQLDDTTMHPIEFLITQYQSSVTIVDLNDTAPINSMAAKQYQAYVDWAGDEHSFELVPERSSFVQYILEKMERTQERMERRYFIAASFEPRTAIAWFNNFGLHTAPLSLNMLHSTLLQAYLNDTDAKINVSFHPLPFSDEHRSIFMDTPMNIENVLAVNVVISLYLAWSISCIFIVRERVTRFKLMQHIAGSEVFTYWMGTYLFDACKVVVSSVLVMMTIWICGMRDFRLLNVTRMHFAILVLTGWVVISYNYLLALIFNDFINVYIFSITLSLFGSIAFMSYHYVVNKGFSLVMEGVKEPAWFFRIFPIFSLSNALVKSFKANTVNVLCSVEDIALMSRDYEDCKVFPRCCEQGKWRFYEGFGLDVLISFSFAIASWIILFFVEYRVYRSASKCCLESSLDEAALTEYERLHRFSRVSGEGVDLENEVMRVLNLTNRQCYQLPLVCNGVTRVGTSETSISNLFLILEKGDCLGMPIIIDSGVKSLFKILSGELDTTTGGVFVHGSNLKYQRSMAYESMGYCPDVNPWPREYTTTEIMHILCLLRGIPSAHISDIIVSLSSVLGFYNSVDKSLYVCSRGIRRRMSCACAVLSAPPLLLLDRPFASMDPAGVRQLWYLLEQLRLRRNTTVLFSTLLPRECEKISNRLAIVANGRLVRIGSAWDFCLKKRHFFLFVKMKRTVRGNPHATENLLEYLSVNFRMVSLKEQYGDILIFMIPYSRNKISHVFELLQMAAFSLYIETFGIHSETFSTVFRDCVEHPWKSRMSYLS